MQINFWNDPINFLANWVTQLLLGWGASDGLALFIKDLLGVAILAIGSLLFVLFLIWFERKLVGRLQDRLGPNRIGPFGLIQPVADMLKIFTKEYITPIGADLVPYNLAPILAVSGVMLLWAVIPFANHFYGVDLNVAALYMIAVGAIGTLGVIMAGWSSNNKYAMLGAFRSVALLVSYEVPMTMTLLIPVLLSRSMGFVDIINSQDIWYIFIVPLPAVIFFLTCIAEVSRSPFDLVEADSEIVAGFNIEYSGLKFGMFYVAEFLHGFTISILFAVLFLGGWRGPGAEEFPLLGVVYLMVKTFVVYFIQVWIRTTMPRFRIDQMMDFNWKVLTPLALTCIIVISLVEKIMANSPDLVRWISLLLVNIVVALIAGQVMRDQGKQIREKAEAEQENHAVVSHAQEHPSI